jgi:hypothetical protein
MSFGTAILALEPLHIDVIAATVGVCAHDRIDEPSCRSFSGWA